VSYPGGQEATGAGARLWCAACGQLAAASGGTAVHAASGLRLGDYGHPVDPVDREPELWRAAREIAADYGGMFTLDARFGFLRADWSEAPAVPGAVAAHYEADGKTEMRRQLDAAVAVALREQPAQAPR